MTNKVILPSGEMSVISTVTRKDIRAAVEGLTSNSARLLVDAYYTTQENRIAQNNRIIAMKKDGEPTALFEILASQAEQSEDMIKKALNDFTLNHKMGSWMRGIHGIGPVLAAGLLAHIDINMAPTAGHIWSFAGLVGKKWEKGQKRPWNASLKVICYKISMSFVKLSGSEKCHYGHLYRKRKEWEVAKNDRGDNAAAAALLLSEKNYSEDKDTYACLKSGKLSPGHVDARARRYVVKIFLSHLQAEWYRREFNKEPPAPFAIAIQGHAHMIDAWN